MNIPKPLLAVAPTILAIQMLCFGISAAQKLELADLKYRTFIADASFISDSSLYVADKTGIAEMALHPDGSFGTGKFLFIPGNVLSMARDENRIYLLTRQGGMFAIRDAGNAFAITDSLRFPEMLNDMAVSRNIIIISSRNNVHIIGQKQGANLAILNKISFDSPVHCARLDSHKLYVGLSDSTILAYDIDNMSNLIQRHNWRVPQNSAFFAISGNGLFISQLAHKIGFFEMGDSLAFKCDFGSAEVFYSSMAIDNGLLHLTKLDEGLEIRKIGDICGDAILVDYANKRPSQRVRVDNGRIALINGEKGFDYLRIAGESKLEEIAQFLPNSAILDVECAGRYAYVAAGNYGMAILEIDSRGAREIARYDAKGFVRDIYLCDSIAYVAVEGKGIAIISVRDPSNPSWKTLVAHNNMPFAAASNGTVIAYSAHGTKKLSFIRQRENGAQPFETAAVFDVGGIARELLIDGGLCYAACERGGLRIFDISNPDSIFAFADYPTNGFCRGLCLRDTLLFLACGEDGIRILNIANMPKTKLVSHIQLSSCSDVHISAGYFVATSDDKGCFLYDISHPEEPVLLDSFANSGLAARVTIADSLIFMADQYALYILRIVK